MFVFVSEKVARGKILVEISSGGGGSGYMCVISMARGSMISLLPRFFSFFLLFSLFEKSSVKLTAFKNRG